MTAEDTFRRMGDRSPRSPVWRQLRGVGRSWLRRSACLVVGAAALAAALTGCRVQTQVAVYQASSGRGVVAVSVSLDRAALTAIGGAPALAAQLQTADLRSAGWTVTRPVAGPGSTTVVSASHAYATPAQASALVAELAGSGPAGGGGRPFQLSLQQRNGFWRNETVLGGQVDLRCGLNCFGDSGLSSALGFPTGVNPAALAGPGQQPDQVFTFSFDTRLPGHLVSSNGTALPDGGVRWTPGLGQRLQLAALTRTWNTGRIVAAIVAAGVVVVLGIGLAVYWWLRRRRRRRGHARRRRGERSELAASSP
jgi:hypothetical protein